MTKNSSQKKAEQLGMPAGTANAILKKSIMFSLVKKLGLDVCHRCKKPINKIEDFSIEHIVDWMDSDNPVELFFNLENITFSHLKCNISSVRKKYLIENGKKWSKNNIIECEEGMSPCSCCKKIKPISEFHKDKGLLRGVHSECKECRKEVRKKHGVLGENG